MQILLALIVIGNTILTTVDNIHAQANGISPNNPCVRAIPQPIVNSKVFPKTKFLLKQESNNGLKISTGTETVDFNNGDRLTITNTGCEYFTLVFEFDTRRTSADKIDDRRYLYKRSAWLMKQVLPGVDAPLDLKRGILALEKYATTHKQPQLDTEINYANSSPDFRSVVRLESVNRLKNHRLGAKVIFYYGPL